MCIDARQLSVRVNEGEFGTPHSNTTFDEYVGTWVGGWMLSDYLLYYDLIVVHNSK